MSDTIPQIAVAEELARKIAALSDVPPAVRTKCEDLLVDVVGLCVAARNEDYVKATLAACDDDGPCTAGSTSFSVAIFRASSCATATCGSLSLTFGTGSGRSRGYG